MRNHALPAALLALTLQAAIVGKSQASAQEALPRSAIEAQRIGVEAVVYGLPLVLMDLTRQQATNVAGPQPNAQAPINQFGSMLAFPPVSAHGIARMNVDTLSSLAWLDLSKEAMVLSLPDTGERYYVMPMLDAWSNVFASPGKRTSGTQAASFVITGPGWDGTLPDGVERIAAPTNTVWIAGRTQTNGSHDYARVRQLQKQYRITPLSAFGKRHRPAPGVVDAALATGMAPVEAVSTMDTTTFFNRLSGLLQANPPPAADAPAVARFALVGLIPGERFAAEKLDPSVARGLQNVVSLALEELRTTAGQIGELVNGWQIPPKAVGDFGTDYELRAVVAVTGLGANLPADAIHPNAFTDAEGKPLNGAHRYRIHFARDQTPPAEAFWSLTVYDAHSFLVDNPIERHNVASWMPLKYNRDGSLDIHLQTDSPGKARESNWLPAAAGDFSVTLRVYWPKAAMLDGSWPPPPIRRVD